MSAKTIVDELVSSHQGAPLLDDGTQASRGILTPSELAAAVREAGSTLPTARIEQAAKTLVRWFLDGDDPVGDWTEASFRQYVNDSTDTPIFDKLTDISLARAARQARKIIRHQHPELDGDNDNEELISDEIWMKLFDVYVDEIVKAGIRIMRNAARN